TSCRDCCASPHWKMPRPVLRVILAPPTDDNKGGINEPLTHRLERAAAGRTGLRPAWRRSTGTRTKPRTAGRTRQAGGARTGDTAASDHRRGAELVGPGAHHRYS